MGYLKTLTSNDIIVTPFTVNKKFSYSGNPPGYNTSSVSVFDGQNTSYPEAGGNTGTGSLSLVYNSIKQLYYTNYISGSEGRISNASTASFNPDGTISGPAYNTIYDNTIQSLDELRYFPTESNDQISVLSIPSKQFGEYIKPGSFSADDITEDGQGNIFYAGENAGNIIYKAGLVIFTNTNGIGGTWNFPDPKWESSVTIYETQYKCTIRANEFNYSLNPSLISSSLRGQNKILTDGSSQYSDFVTGSDFSPYVTTVGLYNNQQELLAVAKLAQPLPTSQTTDTTILINLDR